MQLYFFIFSPVILLLPRSSAPGRGDGGDSGGHRPICGDIKSWNIVRNKDYRSVLTHLGDPHTCASHCRRSRISWMLLAMLETFGFWLSEKAVVAKEKEEKRFGLRHLFLSFFFGAISVS